MSRYYTCGKCRNTFPSNGGTSNCACGGTLHEQPQTPLDIVGRSLLPSMLQRLAAKTHKENQMSTQETPTETPSMLDSLASSWVAQLDSRIAELAPVIHEYDEAVEMRARLTGDFRPSRARSPRPAERLRAEHSGHRGRPRGTGKRSQEVIDLISAEGGKTVAEVAEALSIKPNYLYRVMPDLVKEGKLRKDGSTFTVAHDDAEAAA